FAGQLEQDLRIRPGELDGEVRGGAVGVLGDAVNDRLGEIESRRRELRAVAITESVDELGLGPEVLPALARPGPDHHLDSAWREWIGAVVIASGLYDGELDVGEIEGDLAQTPAVLAGLLERRPFGKARANPEHALVEVRQELGAQARHDRK